MGVQSIKKGQLTVRTLRDEVSNLREGIAAYSDEVKNLVVALEKRVNDAATVINRLTEANNAATLLLSCVERHLDAKSPGWDEGMRADMERKAKLLSQRSILHQTIQRGEPETRGEAAASLWEIAKELKSTEQDGLLCLAGYLKAGNVGAARLLHGEYIELHPAPHQGVKEILDRFAERIGELSRISLVE